MYYFFFPQYNILSVVRIDRSHLSCVVVRPVHTRSTCSVFVTTISIFVIGRSNVFVIIIIIMSSSFGTGYLPPPPKKKIYVPGLRKTQKTVMYTLKGGGRCLDQGRLCGRRVFECIIHRFIQLYMYYMYRIIHTIYFNLHICHIII